jgi:hypothetical protein
MITQGKRVVQIREVSTIASETGEELKNSRLEVGGYESEPPYVKIYLDDIGRLQGLNKSEQLILNELVFNMGYKNVVPAYKPVKQMICQKVGMNYNTLEKALKQLHAKGILIRQARGFYVMDPNLFGRGKWQDIKKIRMIIDYNSDGTKTINTEISKQLGLF